MAHHFNHPHAHQESYLHTMNHLSPVSMVSARNAWNHNALLWTKYGEKKTAYILQLLLLRIQSNKSFIDE